MGSAPLRLIVLTLLLLAPLAHAQETSPVLLERTSDGNLPIDVGMPASAVYHLFNLNPTDDFYVSVTTNAPSGWSAVPSADRFFLGPRNETDVEIRFEPNEELRGVLEIEVVFSFVHGSTGVVTQVTDEITVRSTAPPRVLGLVPNPLGAPLDNAYGTFILDMLAWAAIATATVLVGNALIRIAMARSKEETASAVIAKLARPVLIMIVLLGLSWSFATLPRNPVTSLISKFLIAIAVTVFGLYVVYRGLDAALVYYQREIAPRTATKVDDVLVPAFRKVGLVIIYVVGIVLTLRNLGWDPTLIFAGAGIAGLVLAFAAQDTFSNLFSGIFLMLDRPFVEGDQIRLETGEDAIVESIGLRTTRLYSEKIHESIIVPNNQLATKRIVNHHAYDLKYRIAVEVGVSYGSDPRHVERVLLELANAQPECVKEGRFIPSVRFLGFQDSALQFAVRMYIHDFTNRGRVSSNLRFGIHEAFKREKIETPFPQRVVHMKDAR